MKRRQLDWDAIALAGDSGLAPPRILPAAPEPRRRKSRRLTIAILLAWLAWEGAGLVRALTVGPPILSAMWKAAQ